MVTEKLTHNDDDPNAAPWYVDGVAIWLAVAVVSLVTAISDYQKEGEFLKKQMIEENSKVVSKSPKHFHFMIIKQMDHILNFDVLVLMSSFILFELIGPYNSIRF